MRPIIDVESAELRLWQQQCLVLVDVPSARQNIWIKGLCGCSRMCRLCVWVCTHRSSRFQGQSYLDYNIFMFNDGRASAEDAKPCYSVLEAIKDGTTINVKYQSEVVRFKTPNTVILFQMLTQMLCRFREINVKF